MNQKMKNSLSFHIHKTVLEILPKILMLVFLLLYACKPSPQEEVTTHPEIDFNTLHQLLYENPEDARQFSLSYLDSIGNQDLESKIVLLKAIGSSYVFESEYPQAITYYSQALTLAESIEFYKEIANLNNNLGMIYNEIGNAKVAYSYYLTALDNYEAAHLPDKKVGTLNNIGVVFLNMNNKDKALTYFEDALKPTNFPKDTILVASVLNNIAICYLDKDSDTALYNLDKAIGLSEKVHNQYGLCISYQTMGNIFLKMQESQKAYEAYHKSLSIAQEANLSYQESLSKVGLARVLLQMKKNDKAVQLAFEVMDDAKKNESLRLKSESHLLLSDIYRENGDYKNSLVEYQKNIETQKDLNDQTVINQIYDTEVGHLNQQNKMQSLELERKELAIQNKNTLLLSALIIFILGIGGFYLIYRNHHHKQKVKLQETIIEFTQKKSKAAIEAELSERKRIGTELHDRIGYLLSLTGLQVSLLLEKKTLTEEKKDSLLASIAENIDETFDEVRNISHNLSPSLLSIHGLKGALNNISAKINQSSQLKMSFDIFGLDTKIESLIEHVLYRSLQEIINNVIKHSHASELFIQLVQDADQITLMAEDNGVGFDTSQEKEFGLGLENIKSRIENLDGSLYVDSKKGRGTIISIVIPL